MTNRLPEDKISPASTLELGKPEASRNMRRVRDAIPWRVLVVATIGFWERAAFWGSKSSWNTALQIENLLILRSL